MTNDITTLQYMLGLLSCITMILIIIDAAAIMLFFFYIRPLLKIMTPLLELIAMLKMYTEFIVTHGFSHESSKEFSRHTDVV